LELPKVWQREEALAAASSEKPSAPQPSLPVGSSYEGEGEAAPTPSVPRSSAPRSSVPKSNTKSSAPRTTSSWDRSSSRSRRVGRMPMAPLKEGDRALFRRAVIALDDWAVITARDVETFIGQEARRREERKEKQKSQREALDQQLRDADERKERERQERVKDLRAADAAALQFEEEQKAHRALVRTQLREQQRERDVQIKARHKRQMEVQQREEAEDAALAERARREEVAHKEEQEKRKQRAREFVLRNHEFNKALREHKEQVALREAEIDKGWNAGNLPGGDSHTSSIRHQQQMAARLQWASASPAMPAMMKAKENAEEFWRCKEMEGEGELIFRSVEDDEKELMRKRLAKSKMHKFLQRQIQERNAECEKELVEGLAIRRAMQEDTQNYERVAWEERTKRKQAARENQRVLERQVVDRSTRALAEAMSGQEKKTKLRTPPTRTTTLKNDPSPPLASYFLCGGHAGRQHGIISRSWVSSVRFLPPPPSLCPF